MASAVATRVLSDPRFRQVVGNVARGAVRGLGRSRQRRANRKKWYFGRRVGIPPRFNGRQRQRANRVLNKVVATSQPIAKSTLMQNIVGKPLPARGSEWLVDVSAHEPQNGIAYDWFPINPAEPTTFPRLSVIASQYQRYMPVAVTLVYTSTCSTTQVGNIIMAPIRDPTQEIPNNPQDLAGLAGAVRGSVHDAWQCDLPAEYMSNALNGFYCSPSKGTSPSDADPMKVCGTFVVMTDGVEAADGVVGNLQINYQFTLSDPQTKPEGSTLAGKYVMEDLTSVCEPSMIGTISGTPAVIEWSPTEWRKRSTAPCLVGFKGTDTAYSLGATLTIDSVVQTPIISKGVGNGDIERWWWLPKGRQWFTVECDPCTDVVLHAIQTGPYYTV